MHPRGQNTEDPTTFIFLISSNCKLDPILYVFRVFECITGLRYALGYFYLIRQINGVLFTDFFFLNELNFFTEGVARQMQHQSKNCISSCTVLNPQSGLRVLNTVPVKIKGYKSLVSFKSRLKVHTSSNDCGSMIIIFFLVIALQVQFMSKAEFLISYIQTNRILIILNSNSFTLVIQFLTSEYNLRDNLWLNF